MLYSDQPFKPNLPVLCRQRKQDFIFYFIILYKCTLQPAACMEKRLIGLKGCCHWELKSSVLLCLWLVWVRECSHQCFQPFRCAQNLLKVQSLHKQNFEALFWAASENSLKCLFCPFLLIDRTEKCCGTILGWCQNESLSRGIAVSSHAGCTVQL